MSANMTGNPFVQPMILEEKSIKTFKKNQYIAGFVVSLGGFCAGTVLAWTSPALGFLLESQNSTASTNHTTPTAPGFKISTTEEAIVGAILMLGGLLFAIPSGKFADIFGRKPTLILIAVLYFLSFVLVACATDVAMLVVARFFGGLALGGCCVVVPMYIGEISEESLRGVLGSSFSVMLALGILYTSVIGIFANWLWLSVALAIMPLVATVSVLFLPETPLYLVSAERYGRAKRALLFFRGNERAATEELTQLKKNFTEQEEEGTLYDLFTRRRYRRPLIAGLGVFMYQQLCGINVVVFYLAPIFEAAGTAVSPPLAATTTNLIAFIAGITAVFVIEKRSRKYFLMLSSLSMLIGTIGLGIFFHLKQHKIYFPGLQMLPISCVVLFMASFSIGLGPVPWILLIELFTPEIRGIASGVAIISNWLSAFCVTFSYPYLMVSLGSAWTFCLYGLINLLGLVFIWFVVPETKSKTKA